jgi:16S rRNA (adenine1518-N6/adenine1519-N6)-dimethyltransferase
MAALRNTGDSALPPLRDIIQRYELTAQKSLGQHFLLDGNLTSRIARQAGNLETMNVIEIGPGPGGLTRALLAAGAASVTAVEMDRRCVTALGHLVEAYGGRLRLLGGDALRFDPSSVPAPRMIVANLPYNISAPLIIKWLRIIGDLEGLVIMVQKEVAERLAAPPGNKSYGRLSVITQWLCAVDIAFHVDPRAFTPPPKVVSSVVVLKPRTDPIAPARWQSLEAVTAAAFNQRRKMLRSSLKAMKFDFAALGIEPTARAEELSIADFCRLARAHAAANPAPA